MKNNKGFTLIELLVVISIIAILSAIGFSQFNNARRNSTDAATKTQVNEIAKSAESYRVSTSTTDQYPSGSGVIAPLLSQGRWPTGGYTYGTITAVGATQYTDFCVMSPALLNPTGGNCNACDAATAVVTWQTTGTANATNFCVKSRQ